MLETPRKKAKRWKFVILYINSVQAYRRASFVSYISESDQQCNKSLDSYNCSFVLSLCYPVDVLCIASYQAPCTTEWAAVFQITQTVFVNQNPLLLVTKYGLFTFCWNILLWEKVGKSLHEIHGNEYSYLSGNVCIFNFHVILRRTVNTIFRYWILWDLLVCKFIFCNKKLIQGWKDLFIIQLKGRVACKLLSIQMLHPTLYVSRWNYKPRNIIEGNQNYIEKIILRYGQFLTFCSKKYQQFFCCMQ